MAQSRPLRNVILATRVTAGIVSAVSLTLFILVLGYIFSWYDTQSTGFSVLPAIAVSPLSVFKLASFSSFLALLNLPNDMLTIYPTARHLHCLESCCNAYRQHDVSHLACHHWPPHLLYSGYTWLYRVYPWWQLLPQQWKWFWLFELIMVEPGNCCWWVYGGNRVRSSFLPPSISLYLHWQILCW